MKLTKEEILSVRYQKALGFDDLKGPATGVSTDSRDVKPGDLFIAIRGEKYDGHNFVTAALQAGAVAVIIDRKWSDANQPMLISVAAPKLVVDDTIRALGEIARLHRRKFKIPFLAVGGSNGKTTTKEMIRAILERKFNVLATEGNLNNHIGVPQTLFRLEKQHSLAVIEVGTNHFGEIKYLCEVLEPTHGLITNIGQEHLEFFGDVKGVAKAEGELFEWLRYHKETALVNKDDGHIARLAKGVKSVTFGMKAQGVQVKGSVSGFDERARARLRVKPKGKNAFDVDLSVPGEHNAKNALAAAAVGITFKVPVSGIQKALSSFTAASKRMEVFHVGGVTVLNDCYNANPDSVLAALSTLRSFNSSGKRVAVLADMLELGEKADEQHRRVGRMVSKSNVGYLLTFGTLSRFTNETADVKFKAHYDEKSTLCGYLAELLSEGDIVLIKGSRGMRMEEVVEFLKGRLQTGVSAGERAA